jgi:hypothetical protein
VISQVPKKLILRVERKVVVVGVASWVKHPPSQAVLQLAMNRDAKKSWLWGEPARCSKKASFHLPESNELILKRAGNVYPNAAGTPQGACSRTEGSLDVGNASATVRVGL